MEARRDLVQIPAGRPYRTRSETRVERRAIVELHGCDEDQVGLATESVGYLMHARSQTWRPGDERRCRWHTTLEGRPARRAIPSGRR